MFFSIKYQRACEGWDELIKACRNGTATEEFVLHSARKRHELMHPHRPIGEYAERIRHWNSVFDLGFTQDQIDELESGLPNHVGHLCPTSINITLGRGRVEDWQLAGRILKHELSNRGRRLKSYAPLKGVLKDGPPPAMSPSLYSVQLDFARYLGAVPPRRAAVAQQVWPGVEALLFFALNPGLEMDGVAFPRAVRVLGAPTKGVDYLKRFSVYDDLGNKELLIQEITSSVREEGVTTVAYYKPS